MKRFVIAVILLISIFAGSAVMNHLTCHYTTQMIAAVKDPDGYDELNRIWNEKQKLFFMLLPHEQTDTVSCIIKSLPDCKKISQTLYESKLAELCAKLELLRDSMKLNCENIF